MRQNKHKVVEIVHSSHLQVETSGVGVLKSVFTVVLSENVILNVLRHNKNRLSLSVTLLLPRLVVPRGHTHHIDERNTALWRD